MATLAVLEGDGVEVSIAKPMTFGTLALLGRRSFLTRRTRAAVRTVKKVARATGHAVAQASRVTKRMAKRVIRKIAAGAIFSGYAGLDGASGAPKITKEAAKVMLLPTVTAALTAATVTAPLAPIAPVLLNEVLDEIYSSIAARVNKGATPQQAAAEVKAALQSDNDAAADKALGAGVFGTGLSAPVLMGGAALLGVLYFMVSKKR